MTEPPAETAEGQALRRVFLPDTIAEIGAFAFSGCAALERVHLPERLTAVSKRMFDGCGGAAGNFPAEGGQKHRGLCVLRL